MSKLNTKIRFFGIKVNVSIIITSEGLENYYSLGLKIFLVQLFWV